MAQLTYKKMTQQINAIDDYIKLIREILKDYNDDKDKVCKFGDIIDALLCYRNYLKYDKVYTPNDDSAAQQRATADWEIIDRDANGQGVTSALNAEWQSGDMMLLIFAHTVERI